MSAKRDTVIRSTTYTCLYAFAEARMSFSNERDFFGQVKASNSSRRHPESGLQSSAAKSRATTVLRGTLPWSTQQDERIHHGPTPVEDTVDASFWTTNIEDHIFEEEFARFRYWANSSGALLVGTASLDHRLRRHRYAKSTVLELLTCIIDELSRTDKYTDEAEFLRGYRQTVPAHKGTGFTGLVGVRLFISHLQSTSKNIREYDTDITQSPWLSDRKLDFDESESVPTNSFFDIAKLIARERFPRSESWLNSRLATSLAEQRTNFATWRKLRQPSARQSEVKSYRSPVTMESSQDSMTGKTGDDTVDLSTEPLSPEYEHNPEMYHREDSSSKRYAASPRSSTSSEAIFEEDVTFPPLPEAHGERLKAFGCPYCGSTLAIELTDAIWRDHIVQDIKPLICFISWCTEIGPYTGLRSWLDHIRTHGEDSWICDPIKRTKELRKSADIGIEALTDHPPVQFWEMGELWYHMQTAHHTQMESATFQFVAERCRIQTLLVKRCPFCNTCMDNPNLDHPRTHSHIVRHLISIALLAVPWRANARRFHQRSSISDIFYTAEAAERIVTEDSTKLMGDPITENYHRPRVFRFPSPDIELPVPQASERLDRSLLNEDNTWIGQFPLPPAIRLSRRDRVDEIRRILQTDHITLLYGRKAAGKSQLALDLCQTYKAEYQVVVWMSGRSEQEMTESIREYESLAMSPMIDIDALKVDVPKTDIPQINTDNIQYDPRHTDTVMKPVLIVIDGLTEAAVASRAFRNMWGNKHQQDFLITATERLSLSDESDSIKIFQEHGFQLEESDMLLLEGKVPSMNEETVARSVANLLDHHPLALHQVREYLDNLDLPKFDALQAYLKEFQEIKKVVLRDMPIFFQYIQTLGQEEQMLNWFVGWKLRVRSLDGVVGVYTDVEDMDDLDEFFERYPEGEYTS